MLYFHIIIPQRSRNCNTSSYRSYWTHSPRFETQTSAPRPSSSWEFCHTVQVLGIFCQLLQLLRTAHGRTLDLRHWIVTLFALSQSSHLSHFSQFFILSHLSHLLHVWFLFAVITPFTLVALVTLSTLFALFALWLTFCIFCTYYKFRTFSTRRTFRNTLFALVALFAPFALFTPFTLFALSAELQAFRDANKQAQIVREYSCKTATRLSATVVRRTGSTKRWASEF